MQAAQIAQNKMLRLLDNSTLSDRVSTMDLLKKANMLSVNQLSANIKLTEAWKACNIVNYPIQLEKNHENLISNDRITRPLTRRLWKEDGKTMIFSIFLIGIRKSTHLIRLAFIELDN